MNFDRSIARIEPERAFGFANAGWTHDAYPELETLDAGRAMTVAELEGPGVITCCHTTQHAISTDATARERGPLSSPSQLSRDIRRALVSRGIVFEVYYNGDATPAVRAPLADFFLDGCGGRAEHFSTPYVEKAPESYNCFIPMPFEKSVRVVLRNETPYDLNNYSYVEWERFPAWEDRLGYFHATWSRDAFQLTSETDREFFHVEGCGHLLGRSLSIATDEPLFEDLHFIMEGNNEFRLDGANEPQVDYLGTEDAFGLSWGWQRRFIGLRNGTTFLQGHDPTLVTTYRFHGSNVMRFARSLSMRIDWSHEFPGNDQFHKTLADRVSRGGAWVDYAHGYYWYQQGVGFEHSPLPPLSDRVRTVMRPNPR